MLNILILTHRILPECLRYLDVHPVLPEDTSPQTEEAFNAQLTPLLLNMALAALKISPPTNDNANEALKSTTRVLNRSDLSATDKGKALYRRSLAYSHLQDEDDAEKDLVEASALVPGDEAVRRELEKVRGRRKEKRDKQKKAYKGLFS